MQSETSLSILGFKSVMQQQLDHIFLFEVSHDWYLQEEENMAQLVACASKNIDNIIYYHKAINQLDPIKFMKAITTEINEHRKWQLGACSKGYHSRGSNSSPLCVAHAMKA